MTEQQILKKIDKWNEDDHIQAVVDFIEKLPDESKTTEVLSELGRAYNNLYWLDPTAENEKYLRRAIEVFKYLEEEIGDTESWNYRIGYSYFYLNDIDNARKYLERAPSLSGTQELLHYIALADKKGISLREAVKGGRGEVEYILEDFVETLHQYAPAMQARLGAPATEQQIARFQDHLGFDLPEEFKQLHRTFSGQLGQGPFFGVGQCFLNLEQIEQAQRDIVAFLEANFGANWMEKQLPEDNFMDEGEIKNQLFSRKGLPFMMQEIEGEKSYLCFDFDNDQEGTFGQLIGVTPHKDLEQYEVSFVFPGLFHWLSGTIEGIETGRMAYSEEKNTIEFLSRSFEPAYYEQEEREALEEYIKENFGQFDEVFHELVSDDIHCDIYIVKPTPERNYYTLITGGMGAYQMNIPEGFSGSPFAEMVINLPPDWNVKSEAEKDYWPMRWLKILARLPIEQDTFLAWGHTVPTGEPLEGTLFTCMLLLGTDDKKDEEAIVKLPTGKEVYFYTVVPLYEQEMLYKLENDTTALLELFSEKDIPYPPVVDVNRPNVCQDYAPIQNTGLLDQVYWAFTQEHFPGLMIFWEAVKAYNTDMENRLTNFNPFGTIFKTPKVKIMYEAWIKSKRELHDFEILANEHLLEGEPDANGLYQALIVSELTSGDGASFGALELLWLIHNTLSNKDLGDHIFFEGFDIEGYEEDGTPVLYINCGS
ncbi:MAG: 1,3-beta-glucan synthase regulator [Capnocytophaga sp.]|nr:MAG: 1,3-beta-glucan synthase regulator [Capnocytophaga sp.]